MKWIKKQIFDSCWGIDYFRKMCIEENWTIYLEAMQLLDLCRKEACVFWPWKRREQIKDKIRDIWEGLYHNYGTRKIKGKLKEESAVGNYMRQIGIRVQWARDYTSTTIYPDLSSRLHNILDEQFDLATPDTACISDITYIWTVEDKFVYLSDIMELFLGKIVSLTLSRTSEIVPAVEIVEK